MGKLKGIFGPALATTNLKLISPLHHAVNTVIGHTVYIGAHLDCDSMNTVR